MPHLFFVKRHRARACIYLSPPATSSIKYDMAYFSTAGTEDDPPGASSLTLIYEGQLATQDIVRAAAVAFGDIIDGVMEKDGDDGRNVGVWALVMAEVIKRNPLRYTSDKGILNRLCTRWLQMS